jgi:hypothetical protein
MLGQRVSGTLLCHAGGHRVAFIAHDVASIESSSALGGGFPAARRAFGEEGQAARVLLAASGLGVAVDALEIEAESLYVMAAPELLERVAGGSLVGFILSRGEFWPLVRLEGFARYLDELKARRAA